MYYIYDNYHEEWCETAYPKLDEAEKAMEYMIEKRKEKGLPYDFDIYEKVT